MDRYDYRQAMHEDIVNWLYDHREIINECDNIDDLTERLNDDLWTEDSVTGNGSGSYYCNAWRAAEALAFNWDLLLEALEEFGQSGVNPIEKGEEWCDVTIRCYLLGEMIGEVLDSIISTKTDEDGGVILVIAA